MGKYSRLGKNTAIVFMGNVGGKVISLLMLPFYTRWLSVSDYGLTDIISVYATFLIGIVSCCIAESIFIFPKSQTVQIQKQYFSSGVAFALMMFAICAALVGIADYITGVYNIHNAFVDYIWLIYGIVLSQILQQLFQQFTRSIDKMLTYGMAGIIQTALIAFFSFLMIPRWGVEGFIYSQIAANTITAVFSLIASRSYLFLSVAAISKERCGEMLRYSVPLIPNGIMWWMVASLNRPIMESTVGLHGIGLFAVANKFPGILTMLFTVFSTSWQISVIEEYGKDGFHVFYNTVFRYLMFCLCCIFMFIVFLSQPLIALFTTAEFFEAWKYVPLLTLGAVMSAVSAVGGTVFSAVKISKYYFYSSLWGAVAALIANITLIPLLGIYGAAVSVVVSFTVMSFSRISYAWQYVQINHKFLYTIMFVVIIMSSITVLIENRFWFYVLNIMALFVITVINRDLIFGFKKFFKKIK